MASELYQITYKARSPIHIGYRSIGILKTTRYYITGKAVWGALTAVMTRYLMNAPASKEYKKIGEFVKENIRATYFFPKVNNVIYYPVYQNEEVRYSDFSKNAFEKTFIHSFVSTALDKRKTADENTLHETEFIKNKVHIKGDILDVRWSGYISVNEGAKEGLEIEIEENDFIIKGNKVMKASEIFKEIQVGGERNYGFGRLDLDGTLEKIDNDNGRIFDCELDGDKIRSNIALGHVQYKDVTYTGEVEPLVGRDWGEKGSGRKSPFNVDGSTDCIFFAPGTHFTREYTFVLGDYGVWNWMGNE